MDASAEIATRHTAEQSLMIARQPIYNGQMGVFGYELLFRIPAGQDRKLNSTDATAQVLTSAILGSGLDQLVHGRKAILNVTRAFIDVMPQIQLPAEKIVLDLPDNVRVDDELIESLNQLKSTGYRLSIGGLRTIKEPRLLHVADNFRVDVKTMRADQLHQLTKFLRRFRNLTLRALKIETLAEYDLYCGQGFDYFQGYFLGSPRVHKVSDLSVNRLAIMELLAASHNLDTPVEELENKIATDVSLSFRLLKLVNSPFFGVRSEVDSIKRAIVLLGRDEIRKLVSLLALSSSNDQSAATIEIALVRAKTCELLAQCVGVSSDSFFTVGMFSALDVLLEQPIKKTLAMLPLSDAIKAAILDRTGLMGEALSCALAIENARWSDIRFANLNQDHLFAAWREALGWTSEIMNRL